MPSKFSASAWAETELGRKAFANSFTIVNKTSAGSLLFNSAGVPLSRIVTPRLPSKKWLEEKRADLLSIMQNGDSFRPKEGAAQLRAVQAWYLTDIGCALDSGAATRDDCEDKKYSDLLLSQHFAKLENISVHAIALRAQNCLPHENRWGNLVGQIIALASDDWNWAFEVPGGRPHALAMPRPFARSSNEIFCDEFGLPTTFVPDYFLAIARNISPGCSRDRQFHCLTMTKDIDDRQLAHLPVLAGQWKSDPSDMAQAKGQNMYSAVQAAGIYQNADTDLQLLILAAAQGIVDVGSACWPGKVTGDPSISADEVTRLRQADVCLVYARYNLDLATLSGVVAIFMLVYDATRTHVAAAHDMTEPQVAAAAAAERDHVLCEPRTRPAGLDVVAGPLVDWRTRKLPKRRDIEMCVFQC
ncbi:hypothetical protein DFH06DRAFT_1184579 [Mycena polygramma]|nr:hypothetical protein DFH06DRAFT_1187487 [Mycena polygramma]KAJ7666717.1 hypothetical protein DFH06DRAFT_1184579 [Mycena polygramma]